jgi:hypothetical protein
VRDTGLGPDRKQPYTVGQRDPHLGCAPLRLRERRGDHGDQGVGLVQLLEESVHPHVPDIQPVFEVLIEEHPMPRTTQPARDHFRDAQVTVGVADKNTRH